MLFEFAVKTAVANGKNTSTEIESATDEVIVKESTEDSIVNWLAEEGPAASDTDTVIGREEPTVEHSAVSSSAVAEAEEGSSESERPNVPPPSKIEFASVAEEAQDIIRRHLEMKQQG